MVGECVYVNICVCVCSYLYNCNCMSLDIKCGTAPDFIGLVLLSWADCIFFHNTESQIEKAEQRAALRNILTRLQYIFNDRAKSSAYENLIEKHCLLAYFKA